MKYSLVLLYLNFSLTVNAQKIKISEDSMIKKWELATVNIEANSSLFMEPSISSVFQKNLDKSNASNIEKNQAWIDFSRNKVGVSGTAIFLQYENIHFLITARHVFEDSHFPAPGFAYNQVFFPENLNIVKYNNFLPTATYLLPIDTILHAGNLIFSPKDTDIAILALDSFKNQIGISNIALILMNRGYQPIDISDIDTGYKSKKGDLTYAIGFPDLSMIGTKNSIDTFQIFQSNNVTLPVVSTGNVLETTNTEPYLISDVFVYHGNSGGPIIHNNKLIGIVHGANLETREVKGTLLKSYYFLNGNQFIKSKYILPLLRKFIVLMKHNNVASKLNSK